MEERLPKNFDVVVIGTGVTESIVSAAAARNGHTVLNLDPREYYGSSSATLTFDSWAAQDFASVPSTVLAAEALENATITTTLWAAGRLGWKKSVRELNSAWYDQSEEVKDEFDKNKRRFNIDVFPQIILAREELIELLIKSDVSRYLEFLRVGKLFTKLPNEDVIVSIPLSRSDIFTSKSVGLGEKRCLVKFIEAIMGQKPPGESLEQEQAENVSEENERSAEPRLGLDSDLGSGNTFEEMANTCKLTPKLKHLIRSVVENVEDDFATEEAFQTEFVPRCRKYLQSIGRFGNQTPYLWPLYGVSEICQAFCRLSAVYGSIFILKRFITSIEESSEGLLKVKSENDEFHTKHLVIGPDLKYIQSSTPATDDYHQKIKTVGRGVIVTRGSNLKSDTELTAKGDGICFYKIGKVQVVELSHLSQAVPKNYHLLQITFAANDAYPGSQAVSPRQFIESQLRPFVEFDMMSSGEDIGDNTSAQVDSLSDSVKSSKPQAIYGSFFWIDLCNEHTSSSPSQVYHCGVDSTDLTSQVNRAVDIFNKMFPGEEFLPKPPDPEQIDENVADDISLPNDCEEKPQPSNEDVQPPVASE